MVNLQQLQLIHLIRPVILLILQMYDGILFGVSLLIFSTFYKNYYKRNIHYYKCNSCHKTVNAESTKSSQNVGLNNEFRQVLDEFKFSDNLKDLFSAQLKKIIDNELSDFSEKKRLASMELNNLKESYDKMEYRYAINEISKDILIDKVKKSMMQFLKKQKNLIFYQQKYRTMKMLQNIF